MSTLVRIRRNDLPPRLVIAVLGLSCCVGAGRAAAVDDSPPIFESSRARITLADYEAEMAKLQPAARAQFSANRQRLDQVLNNLFLNRAAANDARAAGLDRDPVLARQIEFAVEKVLAQAQFDKLDRERAAEVDANPDKYLARAREIYMMKADKFRAPEKVHVSHILVRVRAGGDEAAKTRAEELRARAAAGAAFADLARDASDDPNAKRNGGDLGFIVATEVDPAFAAAAFALTAPGDLSPVVKATSGYHVILFHERKAPTLLSFDEVKPAILAEIRQDVVANERTAYQSGLLADPAPKVNEQLIDKINREARAAAAAAEAASAKPRR
jgi:peptidyl-prolyl cis-trans isomerase C